MGHYLRNLDLLTNQFTSANYRDPQRQRLYLKDMDTPEEWAAELKRIMPETLYYLNECVESWTDGDGAVLEPNEYGQMKYGKGVAPAGDLMSSLPTEMQALNMMCYIGHEGTYTPAHREMCASLGHNIMVEASKDRHGEKEGTSVWFMTETKEREVVSEYFLSMLGHDIEVEKHFAQINAWKKAPFNVWVVEQRPGDLILIPPLAPHQVWNRGTRTIKAAWNRTTVDTLELALHEALPRARMVCRDEQYKNKAIVYYTLVRYHDLLLRDTVEPKMWKYGRIKQLVEDFKRLFHLYGEILVSEMFGSALPPKRDIELLPFDSNVTCSYCRCNIFNRFLTCNSCNTGPDDTYDICMDCYAMGRSCSCISNLNWVEQWEWPTLVGNYEKWRQTLIQSDGYFDSQKSPQPLEIVKERYVRKPVAQICQEQLKIRPWQDPTKHKTASPSPGMSDIEPEADDNGRPKKRQRNNKRLQPVKNKTSPCHIGKYHEWNWKLAFCTTCNNKYSYGCLWRAFDIMPQEVMENRDWSCPKCQGICSCGKCRKDARQKPYAPKGTLLGHDTRLVADFRSVESLVDFSKTNLGWLREESSENPRESGRMRKLKEKAEAAKACEDVINENYLDIPEQINSGVVDPDLEDPTPTVAMRPQSQENVTYQGPYPISPVNPNLGFDGMNDDDPQHWQNNLHYLGSEPWSRTSTGYPSSLLTPGTNTKPLEELYVNPANINKGRMVGIGYYQQDGSADQILYIPPNSEDVEPEARCGVARNLALSDLIPEPQVEESRKRKIHSSNDNNDDEELFTSKRQKRRAVGRRQLQPLEEGNHKPTNAQLKPRRSFRKPQTYIDLSKDILPHSEDHVTPQKPTFYSRDDDEWALVAQARGTSSQSAPSTDIPRGPARLSRQGREEAEQNFPMELPKRTRIRRVRTSKSPAIELGSVSPNDGNIRIEDDDSLFGHSNAQDIAVAESGIKWHTSEHNPNVKVAESVLPSDVTMPKRRGRPPKQASGVPKGKIGKPGKDEQPPPKRSNRRLRNDTTCNAERKVGGPANAPTPRKSSPNVSRNGGTVADEQKERHSKSVPLVQKPAIEIKVSGPTSMLSMKEKLAMKGKSFKIVARKSLVTNSEGAPSTSKHAMSNGASTAAHSTNFELPAVNPSGLKTHSVALMASTHPVGLATRTAPVVHLSSPVPTSKGPTIVRLPRLEAESDAEDYAISLSSSDESIPAVRPPSKVLKTA